MSQALQDRIVNLAKQRGWDMHWTTRHSYLTLEASELAEAARGKGGNKTKEAADVLITLMAFAGSLDVPWDDVARQAEATMAKLEDMPQGYPGETMLVDGKRVDVPKRVDGATTIPGGWKVGSLCYFTIPDMPQGLLGINLSSRVVGRITGYDREDNTITVQRHDKSYRLHHTKRLGGISGVPDDHELAFLAEEAERRTT